MDWKLSHTINKSVSEKLFNVAELWRIKQYLANAELKLRNAQTNSLSPGQVAKREIVIENLSEYRSGRVFPKNDYVPKYSSVFKDRVGTICAVAHLVHSSGRDDLVEKIASENNLISLSQTHTDLLDPWLDENGITYQEAAFIQVPYDSQLDTANQAASSGHNVLANVLIVAFILCTLILLAGTLSAIYLKRRKARKTESEHGREAALLSSSPN